MPDIDKIKRAISEHGNKTKAAESLGISRHALRRRMAAAGDTKKDMGKDETSGQFETPTLSKFLQESAAYKVSSGARYHLTVKDGTVVVFSDAHFQPGEHTAAYRALLKFVEVTKPSAVICNGDAFDGSSISKHSRIGWERRPSVKEELQACQDALGEIEKRTKSKLIWCLGNHDARFETFLSSAAPQYEGVFGIHLKDHFPLWQPCWSCWINDDVVVKHRWKGGYHAAHNNAVSSGKTMVTGHLHSLKVTPYTDYNGTRYGVDTGCLADPDQSCFVDYTEDGPKNWRSGFVVLTFRGGKLLQPELVAVWDENHVQFRGDIIKV